MAPVHAEVMNHVCAHLSCFCVCYIFQPSTLFLAKEFLSLTRQYLLNQEKVPLYHSFSVCDAMLAVSGDAPAGTLVYNIRILTLLCPLKGHNVLVSGWCGHVRSAELSRDAAFISVPTLLPLHLVSRTYMVKQI